MTDPGSAAGLLDDLPGDVDAICRLAATQTIHHNLRAALGLPREQWEGLPRVWPPQLGELLRVLGGLEPERPLERRVVGACVLESYFLAGLLRLRGYEVRVRAGYFRGIREHAEHVVAFWDELAHAKGEEPDGAFSRRLNELDHRIEHWLCEIREDRAWQPLDANTDFLRLHSALVVEPRLPPRYFEHAHEAWRALRADRSVPRERYAEESTDGETHVRAQLLQDFFSLLNHDLADVSAVRLDDAAFDELASMLASDPPPDELVTFYRATPQLRLAAAEQDPYAFVD